MTWTEAAADIVTESSPHKISVRSRRPSSDEDDTLTELIMHKAQ